MEESFANAGEELHSKVKMYAAQHRCSYKEGFDAVKELEPGLARRYLRGESDAEANFRKVCEERERRVVVYQDHFNVNEKRAREMVDDHDPNMRNIPLDAGSVLDVRTRERMAKGEAEDYGGAMRAVLADDPLLAECYRAGLPYLETSNAHAYQVEDLQTNGPTAKGKLGVLISGARLPSNAPDVPLMLKITNLTPDLVRDAASERLDEIAKALITTLGLSGQVSDRYPETLRQARRENLALVAASESGRMTEEALRQIFWPWFSRD